MRQEILIFLKEDLGKIFCLIVSVRCKLFGVKFFPVGRDYERKELESAHSKAPGGLEFSLWSPLSPV
jgi:hypothetical protein